MARILFLVQDEQKLILDRLYDSIAAHCECDIKRLSKDEQKHLKRYCATIDLHAYDLVLMMTRAKYAMTQTRFLKRIPRLAFLEHDACQNYIKHSKYYGKFSKFYRALPGCMVICSGYQVTQKLRAEGINAHFIPKGYDQALIVDQGRERDIELGFIGTLGNRVYRERHDFLTQLQTVSKLQILQTESGRDYVDTLNRIRFFISADINFGEYMVKNFEAMAAGCILFAWNQGAAENAALGFKDMENVVLYHSPDELLSKLSRLQADATLAKQISLAGLRLAQKNFNFQTLGAATAAQLTAQTPNATPQKNWRFW